MCHQNKPSKFVVGGVSMLVIICGILIVWIVVKSPQQNEAKNMVVENKQSLVGLEINDNEMGSSSHT